MNGESNPARHAPAALAACLVAGACLGAVEQPAPSFDGKAAFAHVQQLVAIGPRVAGSEGAEQARRYIRKHLESLGLAVEEQAFQATTPLGPVRMVNLRAVIPGGASSGRIVFAGHYDTKRLDEFRFVGANDGGSSAAFLLELARVLKPRSNAQPIELLFLDGEEAVVEWRDDDHTYGSRHYVEQALKDGSIKDLRALILVDIIGDRDLRIKRESQSTRWLNDLVWRAARELGRPEFVDESTPIEDDHMRFLEAGVDAIDLIDLDYPWWHQQGDTLDKVAPESMKTVGDVLMRALPEIERRLKPA